MASIDIKPLQDGLAFGARVRGVTQEGLKAEALRRQLRDLFEARGLIVFEEMEPSSRVHVELSEVFGPLKDHPVPTVPRVDNDVMPGVIDMHYRPNPDDNSIVEIEGRRLGQWLPWHYDHCYNDELNRAGVLRAITIPPEGGLTGFADCVQIYDDFSPELRAKIEGQNIVYTLNVVFDEMKFGRPAGMRVLSNLKSAVEMNQYAKTLPRSVHPAVWTLRDGRKVMHVSPWMSEAIENRETPEGDALLEAVCQEINRVVKPYFHKWKPTDMLIWDNWRLLHCVSGSDPDEPRRMQRTTIKGDYGLGYFEKGAKGDKMLSETMV
jgi:taurine dioxygenase